MIRKYKTEQVVYYPLRKTYVRIIATINNKGGEFEYCVTTDRDGDLTIARVEQKELRALNEYEKEGYI